MIIARILPISDHTENSANLEIAQNFFSLSNISVQRKKKPKCSCGFNYYYFLSNSDPNPLFPGQIAVITSRKHRPIEEL